VKYQFIHDHVDQYLVKTLCRLIGVARSGYYEWRMRPLSNYAKETARLLPLIRSSYTASGDVYGYRRVHLDLQELGEIYGKHRIWRIMQAHKIRALRGYKASRHVAGRPSILAPNLLKRSFSVDQPDKAWFADITYIRTWQGWLYLAVVIDLHSRKVVGWSMKPTLAKEIVLDALINAVWRRKPKQSVVVHSDQGSQYGSDDWPRFCKHHNLTPSMSRRANCWDNAVAESFFGSPKKESGREFIKRAIWRGQTSLITSRSSTTDNGATAISAVLAQRPLRRPHSEAGKSPGS